MDNKDKVGEVIDYYNYVINYDNDTRKGINKAKENEKNSNKPKITEKGSKQKSKGKKYIGKRLMALLLSTGFSIGTLMATHAAKQQNVDLYEDYLKEATIELEDEEAINFVYNAVKEQLAKEYEAAYGKKVKEVHLSTTHTNTASYAGGPEITVDFESAPTQTFDTKIDLRSVEGNLGTNKADKISEGISKLHYSEGREDNIEAAAELLAILNKEDIVIEKDKRGNDITKETRGNNSIPETVHDEER